MCSPIAPAGPCRPPRTVPEAPRGSAAGNIQLAQSLESQSVSNCMAGGPGAAPSVAQTPHLKKEIMDSIWFKNKSNHNAMKVEPLRSFDHGSGSAALGDNLSRLTGATPPELSYADSVKWRMFRFSLTLLVQFIWIFFAQPVCSEKPSDV